MLLEHKRTAGLKRRHGYLFAVILAVQVCGCTVIPEQLSPHALSTAEMNVVIRGLYAGVKDLDSPNLRGLKAGRSSNGDVWVCGWMTYRSSGGYRSDDQAFIGTLSADRFTPERVGRDRIQPQRSSRNVKSRGYRSKAISKRNSQSAQMRARTAIPRRAWAQDCTQAAAAVAPCAIALPQD